MSPRLLTSKKWTPFPLDLIKQIRSLLLDNFAKELASAELYLEGRIYSKEICFRVGFKEKGRLVQNNFESSIDISQKQKVTDQLNLVVDAAASMLSQFFENPDPLEYPKQWTKYPFEGSHVFLQFHRENTELEREADRLLGLDNDETGLVRNAGDDEGDGSDEDGGTDDGEDGDDGSDDGEDGPRRR